LDSLLVTLTNVIFGPLNGFNPASRYYYLLPSTSKMTEVVRRRGTASFIFPGLGGEEWIAAWRRATVHLAACASAFNVMLLGIVKAKVSM
jgi:hypothetical protein